MASRVAKLPYNEPTALAGAARAEAARLQNDMVRLHKYIRKRHWPWPTAGQYEKHFKGRYALHSQTIQALIGKLFANIQSTREKRRKRDRRARYPWRTRRRWTSPVWKGQSVRRKGNRLTLPMQRGARPIRVRLPKHFPEHWRITQVELQHRQLLVTVRTDDQPTVRPSGVAAGDPGIIRLLTLTDGQESLSISGRGLRAEAQRHNKAKAELYGLRSRCRKGSRRYRKLSKALAKSYRRWEDVCRNLLHHAANEAVRWCEAKQIGTLSVGDIAEINRHRKGRMSRRTNQENGHIPMGRFYRYLEYKLDRIGSVLEKINEAYSTQTCPVCGHRHKPAGRLYKCTNPQCGFSAHRDEVGAYNLLNKALHDGRMVPGVFVPSGRMKYRRPVRCKSSTSGMGRRRCVDAHPALPDNTLDHAARTSSSDLSGARRRLAASMA